MNRHTRRKAVATADIKPGAPLGYVSWTDKTRHPLLLFIAENPHHPGMFDAMLQVGAFRSKDDAAAFVERIAAELREKGDADLERRQ